MVGDCYVSGPVSLSENYIDGTVFLTLTEGEVKTMVPPLGLVRKIIKLIPQSRQEVCYTVSEIFGVLQCCLATFF